MRQPFVASQACQQPQLSPSGFAVVIRTLSTGTETTFPLSPQVAADGLPYPVDHLSWSWNSKKLAVSIAAPEDNEGWQLVVIDPATNLYYFSGTGVAVTGSNPTASYYREGVFLPDGNLFVDRVCCAGIPVNVTSNLLLEVAPVKRCGRATRSQSASSPTTIRASSRTRAGTGCCTCRAATSTSRTTALDLRHW